MLKLSGVPKKPNLLKLPLMTSTKLDTWLRKTKCLCRQTDRHTFHCFSYFVKKHVSQTQTMYYDNYDSSIGRGRGEPAFWFKNVTAEMWKIVNKINN